jgi:RNA polymerase sigma factor (sigma-70 family)
MGVATRGLFGFLARMRPAPPVDSDADLLGRFVRAADQGAFAALVHRHGPMVLAVCRRRLGHEADAEDAFQAVFLALATSARSITRPAALSAWLYRAAYQIALKAAGRRARRPVAPLPAAEVPMPDPPPPAWETDELRALVDTEVAALPERFRAVVVLCLIEGRTGAEAAAVLGVPVGTIDSRLSTARAKLRARLARRGLAVAVGVSLEQLLGGAVHAAGTSFLELASCTVSAVLAEAAGGTGAVSPAVVELAKGVNRMTTNLRVLVVLGVTLGVLGGAGAGVYLATAADPAKPVANAGEQKPAPPAVPPGAAPAPAGAGAPGGAEAPDDPKAGAAALLKSVGPGLDPEGTSLEEIFGLIEKQTDLVVRVDVAAFRRVGVLGGRDEGFGQPSVVLRAIYDTKAVLPRRVDKLALRDVLTDALAQVQLTHPCTYQVRGTQLVIVPAYTPAFRPGVDPLHPAGDDDSNVDSRTTHEQIYGGVVSISADRKPLTEILAELRKQTGANIVLDPRCEGQEKKAALSINLNDVRLYDALRVIADMAELKMVYAGNVYYVTTPANARAFQPLSAPPRTPGPVPPHPAPKGGM